MNKERLLILATFLETMVPPEQWDYRRVVGSNWRGAQDLSCGTTGCALGWASSIPVLRRAGMHMDVIRFTDDEIGLSTFQIFQTAKTVFEISQRDLDYLFVPGSFCDGYSGLSGYATAAEVAKHIRRFVKRGGIPGEVVGYAVKMHGNPAVKAVWRGKQVSGEKQTPSEKPVKMTLEEANATAACCRFDGTYGRKVVKIIRKRK